MKCKEAQRLVQSFVEDTISSRDLEAFIEHVQGCGSCMEELAIQFLVTEGMRSLEHGDSFDLQKELLAKLEKASRRAKLHRLFMRGLYFLEMAVLLAILAVTIVVIFL